MLFALLLQPVTVPIDELDRFDLARVPAARKSCGTSGSAADIVVCGAPDQYRLPPLDLGDYAERPIRTQMGLGAGKLGVGTDSANVGGFQSNRVMVKLKLPF
jgi:hypothetical protein